MNQPKHAIRVHVFALVGAAVTLLPAFAQEEVTQESFGEAVDVRVVNVDVYVTDKKGHPIEGLTLEDFVLYEDGVEVEVSNFFTGAGASSGSDGIEVSPAIEKDRSSLPLIERGSEPVWAAVYLDNFGLKPFDRTRVLDDLAGFAQANAGQDVRFLLASYDLGLKIHTDFTSNADQFAAALTASGKGSAAGVQDENDFRAFMASVRETMKMYEEGRIPCEDPCACAWDQMIIAWESYAVAAGSRVGMSGGGLGELVSVLGGLPGRKALFYVRSGLQQRPGIGALNYLNDLCPHLSQRLSASMFLFDSTNELEELAARANANRVTLYTVDAGGMRADASATVAFEDSRFRPSSLTNQIRRTNLQSALWFLADQTGGKAILNANQPFKDLQKVGGDFSNFYSLGFQPTREPDGKTHRLGVALREKRKGVTLRFRQSYRDKPLDERLGDRLMATLRLGNGENPLGIKAWAGAPVHLEKNVYELPVHIFVPGDLLTTGLGSKAASGKGLVRVFLAAEDAKGRRSEVRQRLITLDDPELDKSDLVVTMKLGAGPHRIGIGVRDEVGAQVSYLDLEVNVDPETAAKLVAGDGE